MTVEKTATMRVYVNGHWLVPEEELAQARAERDRWQEGFERLRQASRATFEAMVAMRDSINEHVPIPSLESDLAKGPSDAVFCEVVARAVIAEINRLHEDVRTTERHNGKLGLLAANDVIRIAALEAKLVQAVEVMRRARQFIRNGVDLGFIRMPDPETPDTAHETLPLIDAFFATMEKPTTCQCPACRDGVLHASDCAVHNEPAYPNGPCSCGATTTEKTNEPT